MSNTVWYVCLTAICIMIAVFAIYAGRRKHKVSTLIMFYLFSTSITWIGEFIVLGLFNSYAYRPGISSDPWAENLAGHLFLNASMFPAAAILAVTYTLDYLGYSMIIAGFILAEYLFLKLGIYEQHWWRYYMSGINTAAFLMISRNWFTKMNPAKYNVPRLVTFYFIGFLTIHTPSPFLLLMGKQYYSLDLINKLAGNMYRSSIIFIFSYHLIEAAFMVFFVSVLDKWYWKLVPFGITLAFQSFLIKMNILVLQNGWKLIYTIIIYYLFLAVFILLEKYTLKPD